MLRSNPYSDYYLRPVPQKLRDCVTALGLYLTDEQKGSLDWCEAHHGKYQFYIHENHQDGEYLLKKYEN